VSCVWALEVTAGSGAWARWTPFAGWWPTNSPAGNPLRYTTGISTAYWNYGGSFTPMIRPMVSSSILLPIELVYLHGSAQNGSALLTWATAQERDNAGFRIQRKSASVSDDQFENVGSVNAKEPNSSTETGYGFIDRSVTPGTYTYRLIQMDINGAEHVSNTVDVAIDAPKDFTLEQNYPNPFTASTDFSYTVPVGGTTSVIIYNQLGEVVTTLVNGDVEQGVHALHWNGKDDRGNEVAAGSYICKLISGEHTTSIKMIVSR
jgi:hypothetical protein